MNSLVFHPLMDSQKVVTPANSKMSTRRPDESCRGGTVRGFVNYLKNMRSARRPTVNREPDNLSSYTQERIDHADL